MAGRIFRSEQPLPGRIPRRSAGPCREAAQARTGRAGSPGVVEVGGRGRTVPHPAAEGGGADHIGGVHCAGAARGTGSFCLEGCPAARFVLLPQIQGTAAGGAVGGALEELCVQRHTGAAVRRTVGEHRAAGRVDRQYIGSRTRRARIDLAPAKLQRGGHRRGHRDADRPFQMA